MKEIGEYLKNRRIELGISLDEAEQFLKIRKKYLIAIEEGDESVLPGKTYFVGYLRNYANYLQADQDYINQLLDKSEPVSKPLEPEPQIKRKKLSRHFSQGKRKIRVKKEKKPINIIPLFKIALVILLIGGFIFILNQYLHRMRQPSIPIVENESISPEQNIEQEMLEIALENIEQEEISELDGVVFLEPLPDYKPIEIIANDPSWIKIIQNDQVLYEGVIISEDKILVKSDELISLITASPNRITVSYNNNVLEPQPLENYRLISYQILPSNN
ncbi:MAG: helix-turn-helix domain-containing protein [Atribacterota bacterium]|nr:helix-turn-helix domain-containing protein [Atribacterota bacterium]MDD4895417.1 helix-turn-helix domain-containing protein [Atribacterota bacterium]MDD5636275.1 helix-turn-helix domain-containing protein [Atribacterota bacterium]